MRMSGPRLNSQLLQVPLYVPGRSTEEVKAALGLDEVIKLASNESPVGSSSQALLAAQAMLEQAHRYPGIAESQLRHRLAERLGHGLEADHIVTGNGATDVIHRITQAFVFDGGNTVMSQATFPMYHIATTIFGGTSRRVPAAADYQQDLVAIAGQIDDDTRLVYLCSPNNPTGQIIPQARVDAFMAQVPDHVVVLFDESYYDFVTDPDYPDTLSYVQTGRPVLVLRSFSKSAGLANMRVGYAIGPTTLTNYVRRTQLPFHTSAIALAAASASLDDLDFRERIKEAVVSGREYLCTALHQLGLNCLPSQTNFVLVVDPPTGAAALTESLLHQGIIVRAMGAFGVPNAVRISVGSPAENVKCIAAMKRVLQDAGQAQPT